MRLTEKSRPKAGLSKLNSVILVEVDVVLGDPSIRTATAVKGSIAIDGRNAYRSNCSDIP